MYTSAYICNSAYYYCTQSNNFIIVVYKLEKSQCWYQKERGYRDETGILGNTEELHPNWLKIWYSVSTPEFNCFDLQFYAVLPDTKLAFRDLQVKKKHHNEVMFYIASSSVAMLIVYDKKFSKSENCWFCVMSLNSEKKGLMSSLNQNFGKGTKPCILLSILTKHF